MIETEPGAYRLNLTPIIMAGGSGTRLWPLSRHLYPKQFHALSGDHTMLQRTVLRLEGLEARTPVIVCNEEHRFIAAEQMRQIGLGDARVLLEPVARNTAPAIAIAAHHALSVEEDSVVLILPADHHIEDAEAFREAVRRGMPLAEKGRLVTFGIVPAGPETGYGYIRRGKEIGDGYVLDRFEEKPDLKTASTYVSSGDYYWNSGIFLFRADRYLSELERHRPDIASACAKAVQHVNSDMQFLRVDEAAFRACPAESIDYAVMENTEDAVVLPLDARWNDVGSWSALWEVEQRDADGNALVGDVLATGTKNTFARAQSRLVALVGVENLVVVETKDAVLVADREKSQEVKAIVERLRGLNRSEYANHREVYRPWGHYDSIDMGERDQVKRIIVKPGAKLSVQMHHHRAEHWVVVRGTAKVLRGKETIMLTENQSVYIPLGEVHALENPGKIPLELIEVQSGSYLGEDDIVRIEDIYGRT
jgi:mannose-1-phosphate guanylyltransferase